MKEGFKFSGTVGIIVAVEEEKKAFLDVFGSPDYATDYAGYNVSTWLHPHSCRIHLVLSGYGEIAAAAATQYLISRYSVDRIINYGVAGGLYEGHFIRKVGFVRKIVHYGFDLSVDDKYPVGRYPNQDNLFISPAEDALPSICLNKYPEFICASADKFVGAGEPKRKLREEFGADICEMEAAGIVITCNRNHIPCSLIKAVSDGVDEGSNAFDQNATSAARVCVEVIARYI